MKLIIDTATRVIFD